jgi:tRNA 2-thiouridine synthesizing protein A
MIELDLRGYDCPMPVVKVMKAMGKNPGVAIAVLVDKESGTDDIARYASKRKYSVNVEKMSEAFRVTLKPLKV